MNKKAVLVLTSLLFITACGGNKVENKKVIMGDDTPKVEEKQDVKLEDKKEVVKDEKDVKEVKKEDTSKIEDKKVEKKDVVTVGSKENKVQEVVRQNTQKTSTTPKNTTQVINNNKTTNTINQTPKTTTTTKSQQVNNSTKPVVKPKPTQPVVTKPQPKPAQPSTSKTPKKERHLVGLWKTGAGNSGKIFKTIEEAVDWGYSLKEEDYKTISKKFFGIEKTTLVANYIPLEWSDGTVEYTIDFDLPLG